MTDGESRRGGARHTQYGPAAVELRVAARLENLAMLRTLVGAVGTHADLDFDAVADLRLAVDEACTRLIRAARPGAALVVVVDPTEDEVVVEVAAECDAGDAEDTGEVVSPGSFSWHVLSSLTDGVRTFVDGATVAGGRVVGMVLTTRRAGASR